MQRRRAGKEIDAKDAIGKFGDRDVERVRRARHGHRDEGVGEAV
jgi:hypothetical protein